MNKCFASLALLALTTLGSQGVIVWSGSAASDDFYDDGNWDFSGSTSITVASPTDDDMTITGATIDEPSAAFSNVEIGDGFTVTLDGSSFTFANSNGFSGVNDAGDVTSVINLINGSFLSAQFTTIGLITNVDSTSSVFYRGGGDPINSQTEAVRVNLEPGAQLILPSVAEFTEQGADIYVNGVSFATDPTILIFSGNTATAVPEPTGLALIGLASMALIFRRGR